MGVENENQKSFQSFLEEGRKMEDGWRREEDWVLYLRDMVAELIWRNAEGAKGCEVRKEDQWRGGRSVVTKKGKPMARDGDGDGYGERVNS